MLVTRFNRPRKGLPVHEKWKVSIKMPIALLDKMRVLSKEWYKGRGKVSQFANDALAFYLTREQVADIDWDNTLSDEWFFELIADVQTGSRMGELSPTTKLFFKAKTRDLLFDLEVKLKIANPQLRNVRSNIIRKACLKWSYNRPHVVAKIIEAEAQNYKVF